MNKGFKKFLHALAFPFVALSLGILLSSAHRKAKKYKADPNSMSIEKRYAYVYKLARRAAFLLGNTVYASGMENCPKVPALYVLNHKSYVDGLIIYKLLWENGDIPYFKIIAKGELGKSRLASVMSLIDAILIDRENVRDTASLFEEEIKPFIDKKSFVIFPEGTRISDPEAFGDFHPGSFKIALNHYMQVVPVVIYGSSGTGIKENKQYFNKARQIFVSFLPPYKASHFMTSNAISLADEVKTRMFMEYTRIGTIVKAQPNQYVKDPYLVFEKIDNMKDKEKRK